MLQDLRKPEKTETEMFKLETQGNRMQGNLRTCGKVYRNQFLEIKK